MDDWSAPREKARRYSRNGLEEIAAFTYAGDASVVGNGLVKSAWDGVVSAIGNGTDDTNYGWLREGVQSEEVIDLYTRSLERWEMYGPPPTGVLARYQDKR